eukprot:2598016-Amphidinium_carterae.1
MLPWASEASTCYCIVWAECKDCVRRESPAAPMYSDREDPLLGADPWCKDITSTLRVSTLWLVSGSFLACHNAALSLQS